MAACLYDSAGQAAGKPEVPALNQFLFSRTNQRVKDFDDSCTSTMRPANYSTFSQIRQFLLRFGSTRSRAGGGTVKQTV
jgi:hypothetical protein